MSQGLLHSRDSQLSSTLVLQGRRCPVAFLIANKEDSINGIYGTLTECAQISKWAGGIGMHIHDIRANKSRIRGTNGQSDGIIPMLRVFNATARYVNQAGRRKGSIAVISLNHGMRISWSSWNSASTKVTKRRVAAIFSQLIWIPDLFMKRVEQGGQVVPLLSGQDPRPSLIAVGEEFEKPSTQSMRRRVALTPL